MPTLNLQPGEHRAYLLTVDPAAAEVLAIQQHRAGFNACCRGEDYQDFRPAAWQQGWLDAHELGEFAPLALLRLDAEV